MTIARKHGEKSNKGEGAAKLKHISEVDDNETPPLDDAFWNSAQMGSPLRKRLMSLRLDSDLIDWFKQRGPNYQTRMNQVLRTYMEFCKREEISR